MPPLKLKPNESLKNIIDNITICRHFRQQDTQLSQRDRAAGYISFGQKWKTDTGRQYFTDIIGLSSTTVILKGFGLWSILAERDLGSPNAGVYP